MQQTIFSIVRNEVDDFTQGFCYPVDGYQFSQYETIKQAHKYIASQFSEATEYQGLEMVFHNIVNPARKLAHKFFNVDTKDITAKALNGTNKAYLQALFANKQKGEYLRKEGYARKFNRFSEGVADFGSGVWYITPKGEEVVDLRNLFLDQSVECIEDSSFVSLKHEMARHQLEKKRGVWDSDRIDEVLTKFSGEEKKSYETNQIGLKRASNKYFRVFSRFGYVPEHLLKGGNSEKLVRSFFVVAEPHATSKSADGSTVDEGVVLFKSEWNKPYPFKEAHVNKMPGRWLGVGMVETLFTEQQRMNEVVNQERVTVANASVMLFQTPDHGVSKNLFRDFLNGSILRNSQLTPVNNEPRNLNAYNGLKQEITAQAQSVSHAYDQARGGAFPASTAATNATIQDRNLNSIFAYMKEDILICIEELMNDYIKDKMIKSFSKEHIFEFVGDIEEFNALMEMFVANKVNTRATKDFILKGELYTPEIKQALESQYMEEFRKGGASKFIQVTEIFNDADLNFEYRASNESEDVQLITNNMGQLIQMVNPDNMANPMTRELIFAFAEKIGINPIKLEIAQQKGATTQTAQQPVQQSAPIQESPYTNSTSSMM